MGTGYSGTPLAKKLGIKQGFKIALYNQPGDYFELFTDFPLDVKLINKSKADFVHYFAKEEKQLAKDISKLKNKMGTKRNDLDILAKEILKG